MRFERDKSARRLHFPPLSSGSEAASVDFAPVHCEVPGFIHLGFFFVRTDGILLKRRPCNLLAALGAADDCFWEQSLAFSYLDAFGTWGNSQKRHCAFWPKTGEYLASGKGLWCSDRRLWDQPVTLEKLRICPSATWHALLLFSWDCECVAFQLENWCLGSRMHSIRDDNEEESLWWQQRRKY